MAEPASGFVAPAGWFSAPERIPTLGPLSDPVPLQHKWMLWAMLPPPPPPSSPPPAAGSEPSSDTQPPTDSQALPEAPPRFDVPVLPGTQTLFDTQSRLDAQPQISGQPSWSFQASTSWHWRPPPSSFPPHQTSHHTPGRLLLPPCHPLPFPSFSPSSLFNFSAFPAPSDFALHSCESDHSRLTVGPTGMFSLPFHSVERLVMEFQLCIGNWECGRKHLV